MTKLFKDEKTQRRAQGLISEVLRLRNFASKAKFNPYRDTPEALTSCGIVEEHFHPERDYGDQYSYTLETLTPHQRSNFKRNLSPLPDGYIAAIFIKILNVYGYDEFYDCWQRYVGDYTKALVPGNPHKVAKMIQAVSVKFNVALPDRVNYMSAKILALWQHDWDTAEQPYCSPPALFKISKNRDLYNAFKQATLLQNAAICRFVTLKCRWQSQDATKAMLWCIATGTHPVRLLNYAGYWLTHPDGQPKLFSDVNPNTQPYEMELVDEENNVVGYDIAPSQITAGFLHNFAKLILQLPFPEDKQLVSNKFLTLTKYFNLEDFAMPNTLVWQPLPLTEEGYDYYEQLGVLEKINEATEKELSKGKMKKLASMDKSDQEKLDAATGNPLFDMEQVID